MNTKIEFKVLKYKATPKKIMGLGCCSSHIMSPYVSRRENGKKHAFSCKNGKKHAFSYFACHIVTTQWSCRDTRFPLKINLFTL